VPERAPHVLPFYIPPTLVLRQVSSLLAFKELTGWPGLDRWLPEAGLLLRTAAGAIGFGCFGMPIHPVYEVTAACNLRCKHCHARGGKPYPDELDTEGAKDVIRKLAEVPEFRVLVFTGGEPLVRPDIYELISYAKSLGFSVVLATNATLITKSVAKKLRELGVEGIAASIDFVKPEHHDEYRGVPGAFQRAIEGIKNAASEGLYIHINVTLSKLNLDQLEDLMRLSDRLGAYVVFLYQLLPFGRGEELKNLLLTREEFLQVMERVKKIQREVKPVIVPVGLPEYFAYLLKDSPLFKIYSPFFKGCSAGSGMFYIKPNGDVWPCAFVPIKAGNLREQSALEIWRNSPVFRALRDRSNLRGPCATCKYRDVCGGCRARTLALTGDLFASDPMCPLASNETQLKLIRTPEIKAKQ